MEKRTTPGAKAPATAAPARPAARDDAKKQTNGGTRPAAPKVATAPRSSTSTARESGGTTNKPPTRPIASARSEDGASVA
ncbi:hypothetical protein LTR56_026992, partial [Elasticomyces elasticus]